MRSASRAAVFAATVVALFCAGGVYATASVTTTSGDVKTTASTHTLDNALIAETALQYVGRWGGQACIDSGHAAFGQCKQFVNCVVSLASGGRSYPVDPNGDYQASFADVGGTEITAPNAVTGDIIQVGDHDDDTVLHTAIVLVNHRNGSFTVVDANYVGQPQVQEMVGVHEWTPPTGARFWRLGTVSALLPADLAKMIKNVSTQSLPAAPQAPTLAASVPGGIASGSVTISTQTPPTGSAATAERLWVDGKPFATWPVAALNPSFPLDTTGIADGTHHLRAQAITAFGAVSALGPDLTLTIANKTAMVAAVVPQGLAAGTVTLSAVTSPPAAKDTLAVSVDGKPAAQPGLQFDASSLTPGTHTVTITATDANGKVAATSAPATVVTGPATAQRVAVDINGSGRSDLIAVDSSGHLVRYSSTSDSAFGRAQIIDPARPHGKIRFLAAGHFSTADASSELLVVWSDGSAHLYTFDVDGTLATDTLVGGTVQWPAVAGLSVRADGRLLTTGVDGHQSVVTFALVQDVSPSAAGPGAAVATDNGAAPAGPAAGADSSDPSASAPSPSSSASGGPASPAAPSPSGSAAKPGAPTASPTATGGTDAAKPAGGQRAAGRDVDDQNAANAGAQNAASGPNAPAADPSGSPAPGGAQAAAPAPVAPVQVPGVIAVALPLTPPAPPAAPAAASTSAKGTPGSKSDKAAPAASPAKAPAAPATPAAPAKTAVSTVTGHFTADGVLEILTTYSDGSSDLRPAAPPAGGATAPQPVPVVFATVAAFVPDVPQINHLAASLD